MPSNDKTYPPPVVSSREVQNEYGYSAHVPVKKGSYHKGYERNQRVTRLLWEIQSSSLYVSPHGPYTYWKG